MCTYPEFDLENNESNVISLVEIVCKIFYRHDREMYKPQAILSSVKALINCLQHNASNIDYFEKMRNQKKVLTSIGIQLSYELIYKQAKGLLYQYKQLQHLTDTKMDLVKSGAKDMLCSFLLINNADWKWYRDLQTEMMNSYTQNRNIYPQSVIDAKRMIDNYLLKFVPTTLTRRRTRNRTKMRNRLRKRNYSFYSNRTRTGSTMDGVRRSIQQRSMIVFESKILELPKQQQTRPQKNWTRRLGR